MAPPASTSALKAAKAAAKSSSVASSAATKAGSTSKNAASAAGPSKTAAKASASQPRTSTSNGYRSSPGGTPVNGSYDRPPVASTSSAGARASTSTAPAIRMTSLEVTIHNAILAAPKQTMLATEIFALEDVPTDQNQVTETLNSLLRKNLIIVAKNARGESAFKAVAKHEARELAAMDPEEKMVLEHISQSHNQGIWTRSLKQKTGLHQNVISRAIKVLEQRKLIKNVKSVKHPTRKIYMLAAVTPSLDVTGGPWYSGNDLDMEFIGTLQEVAKNFIRRKSFPNGRPDLVWPQAHIPYLPTANDVLEHMTVNEIIKGVELDIEHMDAILNVLVWDGELERIWVRRWSEDGVGFDFNEHLSSKQAGKKRQMDDVPNGQPKKRRRIRSQSADIDEDSQDEDGGALAKAEEDDDDNDLADRQHSPDEEWLPPPLGQRSNSDSHAAGKSAHRRPGPQGNDRYWVYRTSLTAVPTGQTTNAEGKPVQTFQALYDIGYLQTPCGICPVSEFCRNRGQPKVLPLPGEKSLIPLNGSGDAVSSSALSGSSSSRSKADQKRVQRQYDKLLKMKVPPGSGALEDADGIWKGSNKVGGTVVAPVNPADCSYYSQWFGQEFEW